MLAIEPGTFSYASFTTLEEMSDILSPLFEAAETQQSKCLIHTCSTAPLELMLQSSKHQEWYLSFLLCFFAQNKPTINV